MPSWFTDLKKGVVVKEVPEAPGAKTMLIKVLEPYAGPQPGQFNMVYVYGLGEVPLSVSNVHGEPGLVEHTVRVAGAVTRALLSSVRVGSLVGVRGPYGVGWPLREAEGHDVLVLGGGIGFAPLRPVVKYVAANRQAYGRLNVLYGARSSEHFLYKYEISEYSRIPNSKLLLSVDKPEEGWPFYVGFATDLVGYADVDAKNAYAFVCGPEVMMRVGVKKLLERGFRRDRVFVSLERRMRCGIGVCGTCQLGHYFVCRQGPVFRLSDVEDYLFVEGI
ncbi:MAG: FAD/NAD(P)-binding protein [Desulfurococcaceae archaeon]